MDYSNLRYICLNANQNLIKMKKVILGLAVGAFALSFSSCKKDYTCSCAWSDGSGSLTYTIPKSTKSDAEAVCNDYEYTIGTISWDCALE